MKPDKYRSKTAVRALLSLLFLTLVILFVLVLLPLIPPTEEQLSSSTALLEYDTCYEIHIDGNPVFFLSDYDNWTTSRLSVSEDDMPYNTQTVTGIWTRRTFTPLCHGRLLAKGTDPSLWEQEENVQIRQTFNQQLPVLRQRILTLRKRIDELHYFLRVHDVSDEGYNTVADYETTARKELTDAQAIVGILSDSTRTDKMQVRFIQRYTLLQNDSSGNWHRIPCRILEMDATRHTCLVQSSKRQKATRSQTVYDNTLSESYRLHADSLLFSQQDTTNATVPYKEAHYQGETNHQWIPQGHGILSSHDGRIYDGMWNDGKRNGFGILLNSDGAVRIGEWADDVYQGERPTYTTEHIYGIDISRYQHDIGKKHYAIDWGKIRITHLGSKSKKRISGAVDYPVSFCYIKSTEGTTITNKYYANDYAAARRHGIRCGAYHFFSTRTSGIQQAQHFIKNTQFREGDLPPVLDVEPSAALIKEMGGTEVMLNRIQVWMKAVEKHTGVKPILYVSQNFLNKYLSEATDIKENYQVWIARYGEYKPDVKLAIWQLSPDGRVSGIHGEVDINIFNGYRDRFEEFLEKNCITK